MKKKPHKLPCELHDPQPDTPVCERPLDLSDQPLQAADSLLPHPDGGPAAEVTLSGTSVTVLTIRFRQYTSTGESSLLLPLRQALAILAESPGSQLSMGYVDSGGETVPASWLAE